MKARNSAARQVVLVAMGLLLLAPADLYAQGTAAKKPLRLEELMPASSIALVSVPDLQGARAAFAKTELHALLRELKPVVDMVYQGLRAQVDEVKGGFAHETGFRLDDALFAISGGIQIGVMGVDAERGAPNFVAALRTDGREAAVQGILQAIERKTAGRPGPEPFRHQGVSVKNLVNPPLYYAEVGSTLLLTLLPDDMKQVLDRAVAGPRAGGVIAATLRQSESFVTARARTAGENPVLLSAYVNMEAVWDMLQKQQTEEQRKRTEQLGLLDAKVLDFAVTFEGDLMVSRLFVSAPAKGARRGVLGAFQHGAADTSLARYVPKNASAIVLGRFDLGLFYDRVLELVGAVQPELREQVQQQIAQFEERSGFKIRSEHLGALGSDWVFAAFPPRSGGLSVGVMSVGLKNAEGFKQSMHKLIAALGTGAEIQTITLDGRSYHYSLGRLGNLGENPFEAFEAFGRNPQLVAMQVIDSLMGQAWTIEGGRLYVADVPHSLADYFEAMEQQGSMAGTDQWQKVLASAPKGAQCFTHADPQGFFGGAYNLAIRALKAMESIARQAGVPLDLNRLPRARTMVGHLRPSSTALIMDESGLLAESKGLTGGVEAMLVGAAVAGVTGTMVRRPMQASRKAANESGALATLRTISTAQMAYRNAAKDGDFASSLADLIKQGSIQGDSELAIGIKHGYFFKISKTEPNKYTAEAQPLQPGNSGDRYFFVDETRVIRFDYWQPAGPESPPVGG
ncbi:hypothetical protein ACFL59_02605 [Planctomycetota bacterium]